MNNAVLRQSERIYGLLLKLYPQRYQEEFGEEMRYVFSESLTDAYSEHGTQGIIRFWARITIDAGKSLVKQHVEQYQGDRSMKTAGTSIGIRRKNILRSALVAGGILLLPLLGMLMTDQMNWGPADFVLAFALLFGVSFTYELVASRARTTAYRLAVGIALVAALMLVWANLAVGLIGGEDNLANVMYIGVLAVGSIGAIIARFQPRGMVRALGATAFAQALVTVIGLSAGMYREPGSSVIKIVLANGLFVALWIASAVLFRHASAASSKTS